MTRPHSFYIFLLIAWVVYMMIALMFLLIRTPRSPVFGPYRQSRRLMTVAFATLSLHILVANFISSFFNTNAKTVAIDIAFFFVITISFRHAFLHLLDHQYADRRRMLRDLGLWILIALSSLATLLTRHANVALMLNAVGSATLFVYTLGFMRDFLSIFRQVKRQLENYYVEQMDKFVRWIGICTVMLLVYGCVVMATLYMPEQVKIVVLAASILMNIYIAMSFQNYMLVYEQIEKAFLTKKEMADGIDDAYSTALMPTSGTDEPMSCQCLTLSKSQKRLLQSWIADRRYREPNLTLDMLAHEIYTNRTYLSHYINETFQTSFSGWVRRMRIDDAKQMLLEDQNRSLEEIAMDLGFSSGSYFCRVFSQLEGMSPTQWRHTTTATPKPHTTKDSDPPPQ